MGKYRLVSYYTLTGVKKLVDLGDQAYGEWIVYDNLLPKYHVSVFDTNCQSNSHIKALIESKNETIESIINRINISQNIELSLGNRPMIQIVTSSELVDLNLIPLPELWTKPL